MIADYDIDLQYHPDKINVVSDALSRKPEVFETVQLTQQKELLKEITKLDLVVVQKSRVADQLMKLWIQSTLGQD